MDRRKLRTLAPGSLTVEPWVPVRNSVSKNKADGAHGKITIVDTWSPHVHMHSHTCTQTTHREVR